MPKCDKAVVLNPAQFLSLLQKLSVSILVLRPQPHVRQSPLTPHWSPPDFKAISESEYYR